MEVRFRQTGIGWCTVYAWANVLNAEAVLKFLSDDRFKGCGEAEENEILAEFLPECALWTVAYANQAYPPLPKDFIWELINLQEPEVEDFDNTVVVYMLSVRRIESCWHHVAIFKHSTGLYYLDPYFEKWQVLTRAGLDSYFIDCCQIQRPYIKDTNLWAFLNANILGHEFLKINR